MKDWSEPDLLSSAKRSATLISQDDTAQPPPYTANPSFRCIGDRMNKYCRYLIVILCFLSNPVLSNPMIAHAERGINILSKEGVRVFENGKRYAILVGISKYSQTDLNLKYSTNDVTALHDLLSDKKYGRYDKINVITDSRAKSLNIRKALTDLDRIITSQDTILFFYAGHGVLVNGETYLLPYDAELDYIELTGIKLKDLVDKITNTSAKQKILFLDACHSGGALDSKVFSQRNVQNLNLDNLQQSRGIVIISSSRSGEASFEDDDSKHGIFTSYMVKGLKGEADQYKTGNKNGFIEAHELYAYVNEEANKDAIRKTGKPQHASMAGYVDGPFYLTYYIDYLKIIEEEKRKEKERVEQSIKPVRRYVPVFN